MVPLLLRSQDLDKSGITKEEAVVVAAGGKLCVWPFYGHISRPLHPPMHWCRRANKFATLNNLWIYLLQCWGNTRRRREKEKLFLFLPTGKGALLGSFPGFPLFSFSWRYLPKRFFGQEKGGGKEGRSTNANVACQMYNAKCCFLTPVTFLWRTRYHLKTHQRKDLNATRISLFWQPWSFLASYLFRTLTPVRDISWISCTACFLRGRRGRRRRTR